jgi:hypothetical protein
MARHIAQQYCQLRPRRTTHRRVIRDVPKGRNPFRTLPNYATTGFVPEEDLAALSPKQRSARTRRRRSAHFMPGCRTSPRAGHAASVMAGR